MMNQILKLFMYNLLQKIPCHSTLSKANDVKH